MNRKYYIFIAIVLVGFFLGYYSTIPFIEFAIEKRNSSSSGNLNGWTTNLNLARDDQGVFLRAGIARIGLGANTREEALYFTAIIDSAGDKISSDHVYKIIFPSVIPVDAFWSLTLYGEDHYLIDNVYAKHAVSGFQPLSQNISGEIEIILSVDKPDDSINWIPMPVKPQDVNLTLRYYNPSETFLSQLDKSYLPEIQKIIGDEL